MSLLADSDYLLHTLRLSYLRTVVPSHAPQSSLPGTGPYNLFSFPSNHPTLQNAYVLSDNLTDEQSYPELAAGRSSPPLGMGVGRGEGEGRRRRGGERAAGEEGEAEQGQGLGGAKGLRYSQTIGGKVGGIGMRVSGRKGVSVPGDGASYRSRRPHLAGEGSPTDHNGAQHLTNTDPASAPQHSQRIYPPPPPVVIHSPVRTPAGSAVGTRVGSFSSFPSAYPSAVPSADHSRADSPETGGPTAVVKGEGGLVQPGAEAFGAPKEGGGGLLAQGVVASPALISTADSGPLLEEPTPLASTAPLPPTGEDSELPLVVGTEQVTALEDAAAASNKAQEAQATGDAPSPDQPAFVAGSIASSGISLFGTLPQTLPDSAGGGPGVGLSRERSDSEPSAVGVPGPAGDAVDGGEEGDDERKGSQPPLAMPPPAMVRAGRERRRVNISGRMLVSIQEPEKEPRASSDDEEAQHGAGPPLAQLSRRRSSTEPAAQLEHELSPVQDEEGGSFAQKMDGAMAAQTATGRPRKNSAPSLLPPPELAPHPTTPTPRPPASPTTEASTAATASSLAPPTPSSTGKHGRPQHSPALSFPSRASLAHLPPPPTARPSALSAMLSAQESDAGPSNPYSHLYGALLSKASDALNLSIYFPHSKAPRKALKIKVRRDLTCEEVMGAALYSYHEQGCEPPLEEQEGEEEDQTTKWNLRIVEDDGEVDEDFPALDRMRPVAKFGFTEFALVKANAQQQRDNKAKQGSIVRRPSRTLAAGPKRAGSTPAFAPPVLQVQKPPSNLLPVAPSSGQGQPALSPGLGVPSALGSFQPATMGQTSGLAVPVLLRISLPPQEGVDSIQTTLEVPSDMYISDVLDLLCRKRGFENPREWALMVHHLANEIVVPLDRTVDSLGERLELYLIKRSAISAFGGKLPPTQGYTTNPSASIFAPPRASADLSRVAPSRNADPLVAYESYYVQRKLPVPMGRHPRLIAIDGFYLHFMPSDQVTTAHNTSGRTTSYHISQVVSCGLSRRGGGTAFKVIVRRERGEKRYDFETNEGGEGGRRKAGEIVESIRGLMRRWEDEEGGRR